MSIFLTRISYFGVTTSHYASIEALEKKLNSDCKDGAPSDKATLEQWEKYKSDCLESKENRGYFIFHALIDNDVIAIITGQ